jgi:hypothetical protein
MPFERSNETGNIGYESFTLGDATQQSLREIWNGDRYVNFRASLMSPEAGKRTSALSIAKRGLGLSKVTISLTCRLPHQRPAGRLQISSTPDEACLLALPSGRAILPSTTMGLFQWPPPLSRSAICLPLAGS